jgi:hypothetical protein
MMGRANLLTSVSDYVRTPLLILRARTAAVIYVMVWSTEGYPGYGSDTRHRARPRSRPRQADS